MTIFFGIPDLSICSMLNPKKLKIWSQTHSQFTINEWITAMWLYFVVSLDETAVNTSVQISSWHNLRTENHPSKSSKLCLLTSLKHPHLTLESYTPQQLTCPLKGGHFKRKFICQPWIFRWHVNFPASTIVLLLTCCCRTYSDLQWLKILPDSFLSNKSL